jgi:hypothetical protein|tara:strand:- start:2780 stop:3355 length:576 start_codon:yes stop_codon:yes gene_type:complete
MISRKKNIILIQITIFLVAIFLLYNTYRDKDETVEQDIRIKTTGNPNTNNFTDIEYSGFDLSGNRYILIAGTADFKTETPESINMKSVVANFYLKDGSILNVVSEEGLYNNKTLDMEFRKNVKAVYLDNTLLSEQLNYSNTNSKLLVSGNVRGESVEKGKFFADNVEYDLKNKTLDFSMFGSKQVKIKIKN